MKQSLVVLVCLCVLIWAVLGAPNSIRRSCCLKYSANSPPIGRILRYRIQEQNGHCRFDAVLFFTKRGRIICSDPNDERVQDLLKRFGQRKQER
ncbi:C-C motif chemokine 17-like [Hypanus sabinus]|uniref:C-C motif chemokine 17-like n=1 Tax=Hypanus sabinus TaxID=79690 RepID=UPI0028C40065|nr:C-C motif chemokine 17-like [Hypanus sabinus]